MGGSQESHQSSSGDYGDIGNQNTDGDNNDQHEGHGGNEPSNNGSYNNGEAQVANNTSSSNPVVTQNNGNQQSTATSTFKETVVKITNDIIEFVTKEPEPVYDANGNEIQVIGGPPTIPIGVSPAAVTTVVSTVVSVGANGAAVIFTSIATAGEVIVAIAGTITAVAMAALGQGGSGGKPYTLQTSDHTLTQNTLNKLGLTKEQGKTAIEKMKKELKLRNDFHGKIMSNGDVVDPNTGEVIGNLYDYVPGYNP